MDGFFKSEYMTVLKRSTTARRRRSPCDLMKINTKGCEAGNELKYHLEQNMINSLHL